MTETIVQQQYDQLAKKYDRRWRKYITSTLSILKTWADIAPQAKILDVACGTGEFERLLLSEHSAEMIVGVDLSEEMLAIARHKLSNYPNVSFYHASASSLPFPEGCFNVIVSANAFHYFDRPDIALLEMRRVLDQAGQVVILDWCRDDWVCRVCDFWLTLVDPAHRQCYTQAEFHAHLRSAGFAITRAARVRTGWIWGLMIATAVPTLSIEANQEVSATEAKHLS